MRFEFTTAAGDGDDARRARGRITAAPPLERDALFVRQANAFLDAVEGKSAPLCTLDGGRRDAPHELAILRSVDERAVGHDAVAEGSQRRS